MTRPAPEPSPSDAAAAGTAATAGTDVAADDPGVDGDARPASAEPDAYTDDGTLGGLGGSDSTPGGAG